MDHSDERHAAVPRLPDELGAGLARLASLMERSSSVVVLTGAGISTESGLPDYRGVEGLWRNRSFAEMASIETFHRSPAAFWEFYRMRLAALRDAEPNAAHHAIARLEQAGAIAPVITQNVDGLHAAAGSEPVEVHGSLRHATCLQCARTVPIDEAEVRMAIDPDEVPRCSCGTVLKPDVTLFGEMLPPAIEVAAGLVDGCDLIVACGSSLAVAPVGWFPLQVAARGGSVAVVNRGDTEADHVADVRIDASLGEALPGLASMVLG